MIKMLRDRRKSLNLEYRKSLPIERVLKGERRGSLAAFIAPLGGSKTKPSSLSNSPERKKSERRGSFAALISPSLRTSPERQRAKRRESLATLHHNNNDPFLHPSSAGDLKVPHHSHQRRGSLVQRWFKHISDAAIAYQNRDGKNRRPELSAPPLQDLDVAQDKTKESDSGVSSNNNELLSVAATGGSAVSNSNENESSPASPSFEVDPHQPDASRKLGSSLGDPLRLTEEQNQLIQPNQVIISQSSVQTAQPILTPLEKLRRQDDMIKQALAEKQKLVADILHVPHDQFETFAEMASEPAMDKEAAELILAAVNQANQLSAAVSSALSVTEEDAVAAHTRSVKFPSVSTTQLQTIASSLNNHLSQLLNIMTERDEEREKLRREVQRSREQLHAMHELRQKLRNSQGDDSFGDSTLNSQLLDSSAMTQSQADIDTSSGVEDNPEASAKLSRGNKSKSVENLDDTT